MTGLFQAVTGRDTKAVRRERDFYPTEAAVAEALMQRERYFLHNAFGDEVWEPAVGEGHMADVMVDHGFRVHGTDIADGQDFLAFTSPIVDPCPPIITNPPFRDAEAFIRKAHELGAPYVAMVLPAQYWHAKRRMALFDDHRPLAVYPLAWRPDWTGQGASPMDIIWTVWFADSGMHETLYGPPLEKPEVLA